MIKGIDLTGRHLISDNRDETLSIVNKSGLNAFVYTSGRGNQGWVIPPGNFMTLEAYSGKIESAKTLWVRYLSPEQPLRTLDCFTDTELLEELLSRQGDC